MSPQRQKNASGQQIYILLLRTSVYMDYCLASSVRLEGETQSTEISYMGFWLLSQRIDRQLPQKMHSSCLISKTNQTTYYLLCKPNNPV